MAQFDPTATTASDLATAALKECGAIGVGQTPLAEDITEAITRMQWLLQEWARKRWLVWVLQTLSIVSTGVQSYSVGPGGQIDTNQVNAWGLQSVGPVLGGLGYAVGDQVTLAAFPVPTVGWTRPVVQVLAVSGLGAITEYMVVNPGVVPGPLPTSFTQASTTGSGSGATWSVPVWALLAVPFLALGPSVRPARLESAYLRQLTESQPNLIDYPLQLVQSREDYNKIALKTLTSFPGYAYYESSWPLGQLFPWPVPQANIYSINISVMGPLPSAFATQNAVVSMPFEYFSAIVYNLALRLRPKYQLPALAGDPLPGMAKNALNTIRGANLQIARLVLPADLIRNGIYNIFSDRFY